MQFYSKAALELVYDQVNRDNPHLPVALTPAIAALTSGPSAVSSNGRNTRAVFTGYPGSGVQGNVTLYYDRVNLATLFNFVPAVFLPDTILTYRDALPLLNAALGLELRPADITTPDAALSKSGAAPQTGKITIVNACPAFTGSFSFTYMLEGAGFYPNSGPGPKNLLQGDSLLGYFGTVSADEIFTHKKLVDTVFAKGVKPNVYSGTEGWYKFFYQGKVLYFPVSPCGYNVSWATLYSEGLVYGADGTGKYPFPAASPVDQGRIFPADSLSEGRFYYRVRLPSAGPDPFPNSTPGSGIYGGSEIEMINFLYNGKWAKLSGTYWTLWCMLQNSIVGATTSAKEATLSMASWGNFIKSTTDGNIYWYPMLELVDTGSVTLGLEDLRANIDHTLLPITFTPQLTLQIAPVGMTNAKTVDYAPILFGVANSLVITPIPFGLPKTVDFTPITFTVEIYTPPA